MAGIMEEAFNGWQSFRGGRKEWVEETFRQREQHKQRNRIWVLGTVWITSQSPVKLNKAGPFRAETQGQAKVKGNPWETRLKQERGRGRAVEPQQRRTPALNSLCSQSHCGYLLGGLWPSLRPVQHLLLQACTAWQLPKSLPTVPGAFLPCSININEPVLWPEIS